MGKLIESSRVRRGAMSFGKRVFDRKTGKAREARVRVYFPEASAAGAPRPVTVPHALGFRPTAMEVVSVERDPASGPPVAPYRLYPWATATHVTLHCSTAHTWAEVVLR